MSPTARFLLILSVMVVSTAAGAWVVRRWPRSRQWIDPILSFMIVGLIPVLTILSVWSLKLSWTLIWLPIAYVVYTICWFLMGQGLVRLHRLHHKDAGSYLLAASMSNCGFTMGGFVCYVLLSPSEQALGLSLIYMLPWIPVTYGYFFPWAEAYGRRQPDRAGADGIIPPPPRFTWREWTRSMLDWRSLGLVATLVGVVLSLLTTALPDLHLEKGYAACESAILPLMVLINATSFFSIGHAFRLRAVRIYIKQYLSLGFLRFIFAPLVALGFVGLLRLANIHLGSPTEEVLLIQGAVPTAVFGTIISQTCGLNPRLASLLFVINTAMFLVLVLPVLAWVFAY